MSFGLVLIFQITLKKKKEKKMHRISKDVYLQKAKSECVSRSCHSPSIWRRRSGSEELPQRLGALLKWKQRLCRQTTGRVSEADGDDSRRFRF